MITSGMEGAALAMDDGSSVVQVPVFQGVKQVDATGAGDAFFGGLVASIYQWGFPASESELERMGAIASAAGAANCEVVGALPTGEERCVSLSFQPNL